MVGEHLDVVAKELVEVLLGNAQLLEKRVLDKWNPIPRAALRMGKQPRVENGRDGKYPASSSMV